jgi:hypothetical protein
VNYVPGRKSKTTRDLGITRAAAPKLSTRFEKLRSRGGVDRSIHASASQQRRVSGIYDCTHVERGDVCIDGVKSNHGLVCAFSFSVREHIDKVFGNVAP